MGLKFGPNKSTQLIRTLSPSSQILHKVQEFLAQLKIVEIFILRYAFFKDNQHQKFFIKIIISLLTQFFIQTKSSFQRPPLYHQYSNWRL